jgi:hypothetical protein
VVIAEVAIEKGLTHRDPRRGPRRTRLDPPPRLPELAAWLYGDLDANEGHPRRGPGGFWSLSPLEGTQPDRGRPRDARTPLPATSQGRYPSPGTGTDPIHLGNVGLYALAFGIWLSRARSALNVSHATVSLSKRGGRPWASRPGRSVSPRSEIRDLGGRELARPPSIWSRSRRQAPRQPAPPLIEVGPSSLRAAIQ